MNITTSAWFLYDNSKNFDQNDRMSFLIRVFAYFEVALLVLFSTNAFILYFILLNFDWPPYPLEQLIFYLIKPLMLQYTDKLAFSSKE